MTRNTDSSVDYRGRLVPVSKGTYLMKMPLSRENVEESQHQWSLLASPPWKGGLELGMKGPEKPLSPVFLVPSPVSGPRNLAGRTSS